MHTFSVFLSNYCKRRAKSDMYSQPCKYSEFNIQNYLLQISCYNKKTQGKNHDRNGQGHKT